MIIKNKKNIPPPSIWIFLGPSLSHESAQKILPARYLAPIQRGALSRAIKESAKIIGIIDGSFYRTYAVSPFEIISGLRAGIKFFGASSMGALKAVECESFGMVGIGQIFQWYRSGKIEAEDEVAMVFDPDTLKPLSVPFVNMRYAFSFAETEGLLTRSEKNFLLRSAKKIYFPERSYEKMFAIAKTKGFPSSKIQKLNKYVKNKARDLKALDAIACLEAIRNSLENES